MTRYTDRERLNYLMSMFSQVMPLNGEKPLSRREIDKLMTIWPTPAEVIAALGKSGIQRPA